MNLHGFLVLFFFLLVFSDLLLNLVSHGLVFFNFSDSSVFEVIDFFLDLKHSILEVFGEICSVLFLLVQHRLVFQVQVMVLLKDGGAECLKCFPCFNATHKLLVDTITSCNLLLTLPIRHIVPLQSLRDRLFHRFSYLVSHCVQTFLVLAQARTAIIEVLPFVYFLLYNFLVLLLLLFFKFIVEFLPLFTEVKRLIKGDLIFLKAVQKLVIGLFLSHSVDIGPFFGGFQTFIFFCLLLRLTC